MSNQNNQPPWGGQPHQGQAPAQAPQAYNPQGTQQQYGGQALQEQLAQQAALAQQQHGGQASPQQQYQYQYQAPPQQQQYGGQAPPQQQYQAPPQQQYQAPPQQQYGGQAPPQQQYQGSPQQQYQGSPQQQYQGSPQQQYQAPPQHQQYGGQQAPPPQQQFQAPPAQQYGGQAPAAPSFAPQGQGGPQYGGHPGHAAPVHGRPIHGANATVGASARVRFIRLTYLHLTAAIFGFTGISWLLMNNKTIIEKVSIPILDFSLGGRYNWGIFLALFMAVGYIADMWARKRGSKPLQYLGLSLYVVAEAVIFLPLLAIAQAKGAQIMAQGGGDPHFIRDAGFITIALFAALTVSVFLTKKDFSFIRSGLAMGGAGAMVLIVLSIVGGFNLGIIFSFAMVALAAGYVLYYTSQVLQHYDTDSYVAASLALFSAVALMFWYVIRILMSLRD